MNDPKCKNLSILSFLGDSTEFKKKLKQTVFCLSTRKFHLYLPSASIGKILAIGCSVFSKRISITCYNMILTKNFVPSCFHDFIMFKICMCVTSSNVLSLLFSPTISQALVKVARSC